MPANPFRVADVLLPLPQTLDSRGYALLLPDAPRPLTVSVNARWPATTTLAQGLALVDWRLRQLSHPGLANKTADASETLTIEEVSLEELRDELRTIGAWHDPGPERLRQGYLLSVTRGQLGTRVLLHAVSAQGAFYGLLTLCQLIARTPEGLVIPAVFLGDWPGLAMRLGKTSASLNPLLSQRRFAHWLALGRLNYLGLQYHGRNSFEPEPDFLNSIATMGSALRSAPVLDMITYFCPFRRGGGDASDNRDLLDGEGAYDFKRAAHRHHFVERMKEFISLGASGLEVDYNDWPGGPETPHELVLKLAEQALAEAPSPAPLLYCPPNQGEIMYYGPATPALVRTLQGSPERLLPIWCGPYWRQENLVRSEAVLDWSKATGRKPMLWVNRVMLEGKWALSQPLPDKPGEFAFPGQVLPRELHNLFAGVHLNIGMDEHYNKLPETFSEPALRYFATVCDFLWNAHDWEMQRSANAASHFVAVFNGSPLWPMAPPPLALG